MGFDGSEAALELVVLEVNVAFGPAAARFEPKIVSMNCPSASRCEEADLGTVVLCRRVAPLGDNLCLDGPPIVDRVDEIAGIPGA